MAVVAGILFAFTILITQSFTYYLQSDKCRVCYEKIAEEDSEESSHQYISQDAVSVSSIQLNVDKPFQVVFELFLSKGDDVAAAPKSIPLNFEFFKNLFRLTIAPNAP